MLLDGLVPNWMALAQPTLLMLFAIFCFIAEVWRQLFEVEPEARDIDRLSGWLLIEVNGFLTWSTRRPSWASERAIGGEAGLRP